MLQRFRFTLYFPQNLVFQKLSFGLPLLSCSHLTRYQASLYLKTNLRVCLFITSKGMKIGPSYLEIRGVSKCYTSYE